MLRVAISMLPVGAGSLWVCEGPCDVLALRTAGMPPVVATFGI
jgi:DNA primase